MAIRLRLAKNSARAAVFAQNRFSFNAAAPGRIRGARTGGVPLPVDVRIKDQIRDAVADVMAKWSGRRTMA